MLIYDTRQSWRIWNNSDCSEPFKEKEWELCVQYECVLLETQVVCRELPLHIPPRGVIADMASSASTPISYEFGQSEGNHVSNNNTQARILEGALPPLQQLDPLHYHYLAAQEPKFSCTRCCSVRGSWWGEGETVWEQQWASNCICTGHWAHCPVAPSKAA